MARVNIKTYLTNITDGAASTTNVSLAGVPLETSTIISTRVFTKKTNTVYIVEPYVSFKRTSVPSDYTYTRTHDASVGTTTFTIKYRHPLKPPAADIIEFFGEAKYKTTGATTKIYSYKINDREIHPNGESRVLTLYGSPYVAAKLHVTENPKIGPIANSKNIVAEETVFIDRDGKYETPIRFPRAALLKNYKIKLTEVNSGTFPSDMSSPHTITLTQYPFTQVRLTISDSALGTTLPSTTTYKYSGKKGIALYKKFKFKVSKSVDLAVKGTFTSGDFTQVDGTSSTVSDTLINTLIEYSGLKITIDNTVSPNTAIIEGIARISLGYNSGGYTQVTLDVNNILQNA